MTAPRTAKLRALEDGGSGARALRAVRVRAARRLFPGAAVVAVVLLALVYRRSASHLAESLALADASAASAQPSGEDAAPARLVPHPGPRRLSDGRRLFDGFWRTCAFAGNTCTCTGTLVFSNILGVPIREVNADGAVLCTAEALGAPMHRDPRMCWCKDGVSWGDEVRKGLAAVVRQGLTPRIEIASDETADPGCDPESDGTWHGCVVMGRRWDTSVVPQVMSRAAPPEEQLDMSLRKLDACRRLAPKASLRVLGVRSGQAEGSVELPVAQASMCSVVYRPEEGAMWTAKTKALHCASKPGHCTTIPCECRRAGDHKLELHTPEGRQCWACAEPGKEYQFRVNALAEQMEGSSSTWWPPSGINCPPILWIFMDWRAVMEGCPVISGYMFVFFCCLLVRKVEEFTGGLIPWTRVTPLFGPTLKRGEVWRFFTFTFVHLQFLDIFHNLLTLLDALDVEGTPAIVLGDGSNLKCGIGAKPNFMCYPSIGLGSAHTLGVALLSAAVGGMCSTWINFRAVVTGASAMGYGLSGAIVALYALYAGADLDQTSSVQRSFQDWVWLRLIFVAFHIAMEWVRGISQRDAAGLFAHTASFGAGFAYVLFFLPPMGDGTLLPSGQPYIVPCAYDTTEGLVAEQSMSQCIRLFSELYEYQVPTVQFNLMMLFIATLAFTAVNIVVLERRTDSSEAALLAGQEVSAVCCVKKPASAQGNSQPSWRSSNLEGKDIIFWCEFGDVSKLRPLTAGEQRKCKLDLRVLGSDPKRAPDLMVSSTAQVSGRTRQVEGGETLEVKESLFLPVQFSKESFVQLLLRDISSGGDGEVMGACNLPLSQALRFHRRDYNEQRLKFTAVGNGASIGAGNAIAHAVFRCLQVDELQRLKRRVAKELEDRRFELAYREREVEALREMQEAAAIEGNGDPDRP